MFFDFLFDSVNFRLVGNITNKHTHENNFNFMKNVRIIENFFVVVVLLFFSRTW